MSMTRLLVPFALIALLVAPRVFAQAEGEPDTNGWDDVDIDDDEPFVLDTITVETPDEEEPEPVDTTTGSASGLDEEALEEFGYEDPEAQLRQLPGVYVRPEDAFGLRPNIGLRGANSDRSANVTLMEDGILFGPAPYSAPAAYYFPLALRMVGTDVYKGPAAILYGPQTIGGAVNYTSRDVPEEEGMAGGLDLSLGSYLTGSAHGHVGYRAERWGLLFEAAERFSDGFKELDTGGPTGFGQTDARMVGLVTGDPAAWGYHELRLRLGVTREVSRETYVGLSDADFEDNPYRRYAGTDQGRMRWLRTLAQLEWRAEIGDDHDLTVAVYRHDFTRAWRKVNAFEDGTDVSSVLANPGGALERGYYDVLTGAADSGSGDALRIGTNDRTFVSEGVQSTYHFDRSPQLDESFGYSLTAGLRLHHDRIDRLHTEDLYAMISGTPTRTDDPTEVTRENRGESVALAGFASSDIIVGSLTLSPGLRVEHIRNDFEQGETTSERTQTAVLPGAGLFYGFTDTMGVLAGAYRGFRPVSPGQNAEIEPAYSVNYEAGFRLQDEERALYVDVVGFFSDYSNLVADCTAGGGCRDDQIDQQFEAGAVDVYGAELAADYEIAASEALTVPLRATYTLTLSSFRSDFTSANPQFGAIEAGDSLPYIPVHQASLATGLEAELWAARANVTYVGAMPEAAGEGLTLSGFETDDFVMLDLAAEYSPVDALTLYTRADNVLGVAPIVSRRPYGARPGKPFMLMGGARLTF